MDKDNTFRQFISGIINRRLTAARGNEPEDCPWIYNQLKDEAKETLKELEDALKWYKAEYREYLYKSGILFSTRKWLKKDKEVMANLNKRRNRHLLPVLEELAADQLPSKETKIKVEIIIDGKKDDKKPVVSKPNYQRIAKKVGISPSLVQKYLEGANQQGLILAGGNRYRGGRYYIIGFWVIYKDKKDGNKVKERPVYFISQKNRDKLINFHRPD